MPLPSRRTFLAALAAQAQPSPSDTVDRLLAPWNIPGNPGAAVIVTDQHRVVHRKGYGLANRETKAPFLPTTPSLIGSVAKQFVAMPILMLHEAGELTYDDPLSRFFPDAAPHVRAVTLRHLLTHTSGLAQLEGFPDLAACLQAKPRFSPGDRFEYSNGGYALLAAVAAKITGAPFQTLLRRRVFEPLQMNDTFFTEEQERLRAAPRAIGYWKQRGGFKVSETLEALPLYGGAASIFSTVDDLQKWDQALYTDRLVSQRTLAAAFEGGRLNDGRPVVYSMGWENMRYKGVRYMIHPGGWAGFKSFILRFPAQGFSVIALSNHSEFDLAGLPLAIARPYLSNRIEVPGEIFNTA
ncbi:MAG: serine hydrolase domain-containing protein [Bryobacteraceae bacterium]|nr:serine hydrolase domain-containing protein [Bryobacteraceae bacterium]